MLDCVASQNLPFTESGGSWVLALTARKFGMIPECVSVADSWDRLNRLLERTIPHLTPAIQSFRSPVKTYSEQSGLPAELPYPESPIVLKEFPRKSEQRQEWLRVGF